MLNHLHLVHTADAWCLEWAVCVVCTTSNHLRQAVCVHVRHYSYDQLPNLRVLHICRSWTPTQIVCGP